MGNRSILISLAVVVLLATVAMSQPQPPDTLWTRTYGGSEDDEGESIIQTSDGGFVIVGYGQTFGNENNDVYLIKTDYYGNEVFHMTYGGNSDDRGYDVKSTFDNGFIICGRTRINENSDWDILLIKVNQDGNELWEQILGGSDDDYGWSIQQAIDSTFIIGGHTDSFGSGSSDVYLIKTDINGNEVWSHTFGGEETEHAYSLQIADDGGYILAGRTRSFGAGDYDMYLIKTDNNGNMLWSQTYGGPNLDYCGSIDLTFDGGFILAGYTELSSTGYYDIFLVKTDMNGNEEWNHTFGGTNDEYGRRITQSYDGGYVITGWTNSYGAGNFDVYIIKTDSLGNEEWDQTYGGINGDYGQSIILTYEGGYAVIGETLSYGLGGEDVYLIRLEGPPVLVSNINSFQFNAPSQLIQIGYTFSHFEYLPCSITLNISDDGGLTWDVPATHAWGDIGPDITPGNGKTIYWDAGTNYPNQFNQNMRIKIIADDGE